MISRLLNVVLYYLSGCIPRDRTKVLFGAWMGSSFSDNPKYFLLYLAEHVSHLDLVWCGYDSVRDQLPVGCPVRFVRYGSLAAAKEMLTAGSCFVSHGYQDVGPFNLLRGATLTYLGHGLAIKNMGSQDHPHANALLSRLRAVMRQAESHTYYVAASSAHRQKLLDEYAVNNITPSSVLNTGQPRVDFLFTALGTRRKSPLRDRLLGDDESSRARRLIVYMPTFRDEREGGFSFGALEGAERSKVEQVLQESDAVIVEKRHLVDAGTAGHARDGGSARIRRIGDTGAIDTQELLLAADLLVTDYSGCYLDYLVLDRPVVHFAYDRIKYLTADRSLYFDLDEVAGGAIVEDLDALCACLRTHLEHPDQDRSRRAWVRNALLEYERGHSCKDLAQILLNPQTSAG